MQTWDFGSRPATTGWAPPTDRAAPATPRRAATAHVGEIDDFGGAHDFGAIDVFPAPAAAPHDIPSGVDEEFDDQPPVPAPAPAAAPAPAPPPSPAAESCGEPRSMHKVTSGNFLGGLTINDYYPDLRSRGYPSTAGPFDVGSRAGANVQLYGVIPSPCVPAQFHLTQTVTRTRLRINGSVHPDEGKTHDDIAKSGRDASRPPFRQDFLGGGDAPLGYIISMADPPATPYNATQTIEHDRDFVTSLVGPTGRRSVSWSLTQRISAGTVTTNRLT